MTTRHLVPLGPRLDAPPLRPGIVKGRCPISQVAFFWARRHGRLRDTSCPFCGGPLYATTHQLRSVPWQELAPPILHRMPHE